MKVVHEIERRCTAVGSGHWLDGLNGPERWWVTLDIHENPPKEDGSDWRLKSDNDAIHISGDGDAVIDMLRSALRIAEATRGKLREGREARSRERA